MHHIKTKQINLTSSFIEPRDDDYMCNGDITNCNAIKRIMHLLEYYKSYQTALVKNDAKIIPIYEYISSLKKYNISIFMEDWFQCKQNHMKANGIDYFRNKSEINCDKNASCVYLRRYQRDRYDDINVYGNNNENLDHENIILMDQLNSIHTFIFHYVAKRPLSRNVYDFDEYEDAKETVSDLTNSPINKDEHIISIWSNCPSSVQECNIEQIVHILNHMFLDNEKQFAKIIDRQKDVINYIKNNHFDGAKILSMKRKEFMSQLAKHFKDNKLKYTFGILQTKLRDYDISRFTKYISNESASDLTNSPINKDTQIINIWSNCPSSVQECNIEQIVHILNHMFLDNEKQFAKIIDRQKDVINYIKNNHFDGAKILSTKRKEFISQLAKHFNDNKLKG
eukprot:270004_1